MRTETCGPDGEISASRDNTKFGNRLRQGAVYWGARVYIRNFFGLDGI